MSEFFEFIVELLLEILGVLFDFSNASLIKKILLIVGGILIFGLLIFISYRH